MTTNTINLTIDETKKLLKDIIHANEQIYSEWNTTDENLDIWEEFFKTKLQQLKS